MTGRSARSPLMFGRSYWSAAPRTFGGRLSPTRIRPGVPSVRRPAPRQTSVRRAPHHPMPPARRGRGRTVAGARGRPTAVRPAAAAPTATAATSSTATATGAPRRSSPTSTAAGTPSTWRSRTGSTTSTSARSCATPTRSSPPRCTSSVAGGGTAAARWSPTATSTSATTRRRRPASTWAPARRCRDRHRQPARARCRSRRCELPRRCVLLFGQEGPGLSAAGPRGGCDCVCSIAQFGSTRSINAGVAAASPCTPGSASTPTCPAAAPGAADRERRVPVSGAWVRQRWLGQRCSFEWCEPARAVRAASAAPRGGPSRPPTSRARVSTPPCAAVGSPLQRLEQRRPVHRSPTPVGWQGRAPRDRLLPRRQGRRLSSMSARHLGSART